MIQPILIHPIIVTVTPIDTASSSFDRSAREPIPQLQRAATITIPAQIHWARRREQSQQPGGDEPNSDGFLVFLRADLTRLGYAPAVGDRVNTIEGEATELYLVTPGQKRGQCNFQHNLVRAFFEDRTPKRQ